MIEGIYITKDVLPAVRAQYPRHCHDQAALLVPGCFTWPYNAGAACLVDDECGAVQGRITLWPDGKAAVAARDESHWGSWDSEHEVVRLDCGLVVDRAGDIVEW